MKADAIPLLNVFEKKIRLEVPLYQRVYVWDRDKQWKPLWDDIVHKFTEYFNGRKGAPVHFLGAMVLDQKQTPTGHVELRCIIDGQQRLTTLQIFLAAFRDYCKEVGSTDLAKECERLILNDGMLVNPEIDKFKVWPTRSGRSLFSDIITFGSREALEIKYPIKRRYRAHKPDPRPLMLEAYLFFSDQFRIYFDKANPQYDNPSGYTEVQILDEAFKVLKSTLYIAVIDLDHGDDAHIIFETLNARTAPLSSSDLLRNYIFLRALQNGENREELYDTYWCQFEDKFWTEKKDSRSKLTLSDLFMRYFLVSRVCYDVPEKYLYVEYKGWIERVKPFTKVRDELQILSNQGLDFQRMYEPVKDDVIYDLMMFMKAFEVTTTYPLILSLLDAKISDEEWSSVIIILQSYILRRAVCDLTPKNYNNTFLALTKTLRNNGFTVQNIIDYLSKLGGDSTKWPSDVEFSESWKTKQMYRIMWDPKKITYILKRLNDTYINSKTETITIDNPLTIEHILPDSWIENWPLPDGTGGLSYIELNTAKEDDPQAIATRLRNSVLHTVGNLTILTQELNSALSNASWPKKKPALLQLSLLPINQQLYIIDEWNEKTIAVRSLELLKRALKLWPGPQASSK